MDTIEDNTKMGYIALILMILLMIPLLDNIALILMILFIILNNT